MTSSARSRMPAAFTCNSTTSAWSTSTRPPRKIKGHILVVLIDGQVFYAPIIDEQISNGRLDIPHQLPPNILAALQARVQFNLKEAARQ